MENTVQLKQYEFGGIILADFKKVGILLGSSVLSLSMLSSVASASSPMNEQPERVQIQVASTDITVTKNDLIKRFRELFPTQFDFLTANDFQMSNSHFYPDDETLRHELSFNKSVNGKHIYGSLGFVGENLDIENYYYQPADTKEALFPAKVTKDEAKKIATNFVSQFFEKENYQMETDMPNFFPRQLLTEPISYSFSFSRMENGVSVSDQRIDVSVLGNGDVTSFYKSSSKQGTSTFDDVKQIQDENDIVKKVKENLAVDLFYQVNIDYQTDKRSVELVYQPSSKLQGVHASSGKWLTATGYTTDFPAVSKMEKIVAEPLPVRQKDITVEQAKKIAEELLAPKSDEVTLSIDSVEEVENQSGEAVIRIQYMYQYANGGTGTSLEINKSTGEITQFNNLSYDIGARSVKKPENDNGISKQEALVQAKKHLVEWIPSYLHNYAMPIDEPHFDKRQGSYYFSFPRVVNDIPVIGDQIMVAIAADGSLNSLYVEYQEFEEWPSTDKVISKEKAESILQEGLNLKLSYRKPDNNTDGNHYDLVYAPVFNDSPFAYLDAQTGEWNSWISGGNSIEISHPWAQDELNYLIQANIIDVKDSESFNGDVAVSKGEALKIVVNSLSYFYEGGYPYEQDDLKQTFANIDAKHPLYKVVERAANLGIIKPDDQGFAVDKSITREELAVWYIRILGLEQAAKDGSIYKNDFADADKVSKEYSGYVALANSIGLLKAEENLFNPTGQVTYAELAVSAIQLAHKMSDSGKRLDY